MNDDLGKRAEHKIKEWLDRPDEGYCFDRIPDQMTGFYGSSNICDFTLYKYPYMYYIESKATWKNRFDFSMITDYQMKNMYKKSLISNVKSIVIVLFASHRRPFVLNIQDIRNQMSLGRKSINIDNIKNWQIPYREIRTEYNNRKNIPDYLGDIEEYII